jgi:hypothetical protein
MKQLLYALFFILLFPAAAWPIAVVQSVSASMALVDQLSTGDITTTSGNLFICDASNYTSGYGLTGFTDSKANTYSTAFAYLTSSADSYVQAFQSYSANATGGTNHNFTVTFGGAGYQAIACKEVSGALTSGVLGNVSTKADNSGTTGLTSNSVTTTQPDVLLAGGAAAGITIDGSPSSFTAAGGFTQEQMIAATYGANVGLLTASRVVSSTGSYAFLFDKQISTSGTMGWVVEYKATTVSPVTRRKIIIIQ